jgi:hypothetical protein
VGTILRVKKMLKNGPKRLQKSPEVEGGLEKGKRQNEK